MKLIISHYSAADFWRKVYPANRRPSNPALPPNSAETVWTSEDVWSLAPLWVTPEFVAPENGILHSLALSTDRTYRTKTHVAHKWDTKLPAKSLYALNEDVYVCSPEFVFLQLAQSLDLVQLIAYGHELCGTYCFDVMQERGFRERKTPLVKISDLKRYVESARGIRGCVRAEKALLHIVENCASPMETTLSMLVSLPYRFGGYSLPKMKANARIDVPSSLKSIYPSGFCKVDFLVPGTKLVIEYLGGFDHAGVTSMRNDRGRTVALKELGFDVVELTAKQVWDLDSFEIIARRVSKAANKRIRSDRLGATEPRMLLRQTLREWNRASGRPYQ